MGWFSGGDRRVHATYGRVLQKKTRDGKAVVETTTGDIVEVDPDDLASSDAEWLEKWKSGEWS